jgi:hypothetical protein
MPEIKQISATHFVVFLVLTAVMGLFGSPQQTLNCFLGCTLIGTNLILIMWAMKRVFIKKSVALAAFVIVIKYAAFIGILAALYLKGWRADAGFVVGLTSALPTVAWTAYSYLKRSENNGSF